MNQQERLAYEFVMAIAMVDAMNAVKDIPLGIFDDMIASGYEEDIQAVFLSGPAILDVLKAFRGFKVATDQNFGIIKRESNEIFRRGESPN